MSRSLPALAGLVALLAAAVPARTIQAQQSPTLYARLGGYDAIAAVTDDFLGRLTTEPRFTRFFVGHSEASKAHIRQMIVDQLCAATGGPCLYVGQDMKTAHHGLGISEEDWTAAVNDLTSSLDKFKVPAREKSELLAALGSMKGDIVEHRM